MHLSLLAYAIQELTYFFLKEYYYGECTDAYELIEDCSCESHLEHLRHEQPDYYERQNANKHVQRSRFSHEPIRIVEQYCYEQYVYRVLYAE